MFVITSLAEGAVEKPGLKSDFIRTTAQYRFTGRYIEDVLMLTSLVTVVINDHASYL